MVSLTEYRYPRVLYSLYTPLKGLRVSPREEVLGVDSLFTEGEEVMSSKRKRRRR